MFFVDWNFNRRCPSSRRGRPPLQKSLGPFVQLAEVSGGCRGFKERKASNGIHFKGCNWGFFFKTKFNQRRSKEGPFLGCVRRRLRGREELRCANAPGTMGYSRAAGLLLAAFAPSAAVGLGLCEGADQTVPACDPNGCFKKVQNPECVAAEGTAEEEKESVTAACTVHLWEHLGWLGDSCKADAKCELPSCSPPSAFRCAARAELTERCVFGQMPVQGGHPSRSADLPARVRTTICIPGSVRRGALGDTFDTIAVLFAARSTWLVQMGSTTHSRCAAMPRTSVRPLIASTQSFSGTQGEAAAGYACPLVRCCYPLVVPPARRFKRCRLLHRLDISSAQLMSGAC